MERATNHPVGLDHLIELEEEAHPGFGAEVELGVQRRRFLRGLAGVRRRGGLSQAEVAARMGTSQSLVARLESGVSDPKLSTLQRYSAAVGVHVNLAEADLVL